MKKYLFLLVGILSFINVSIVSADTTEFALSNYYYYFDDVITDFNSSSSIYSAILEEYNSNYSEDYPYFVVFYGNRYSNYFYLDCFNTLPTNLVPYNSTQIQFTYPSTYVRLSYYEGNVIVNNSVDTVSTVYNSISQQYYSLVSKNFTWSLTTDNLSNTDYLLQFPPFSSNIDNVSFQYFELEYQDNFPSYLELYNGNYLPSISYTEINLNNYPYVALSLKNYNTSAFSTTMIVEGQLCLTPVYNYGMTEKVSAGYQIDRCSAVYSTASPMRVDILDSDLKNNAIYYLKAYDTTIINKIKVDTSIFNITYITSDTENKPYVNVNGTYYPSIPYSNLTSSATLSEEEGYVSGRVENVFDVSSDSSFISELFSNPLNALQTTWSAIIVMFTLIGSFIGLLPQTLQAFLFTAFSIGICLGIIKILI